MRVEELHDWFVYDPETGLIEHKDVSGRKTGPAGRSHSKGYLAITVRGRTDLVHRVAWAMHHGKWPEQQIDHINGDKTDNRIANLREATQEQNMWNRPVRRDSKSGVKGVCWYARARKWRARIKRSGRWIELGCYADKEKAAEAYIEAAQKYHGDFANWG